MGKKIGRTIFVCFIFLSSHFSAHANASNRENRDKKMGGQKDRRNAFCMVSFFCPPLRFLFWFRILFPEPPIGSGSKPIHDPLTTVKSLRICSKNFVGLGQVSFRPIKRFIG